MTGGAELGLPEPVLVIGSGLIGTSVALALRRVGIDVLVSDVDPACVRTAVDLGAGRPLAPDDVPAVVVVAVPPSHAGAVLADASRRWPEATLTDVASVKGSVLGEAVAAGADPRRLVGGHPMAGREVSGAAGALANLFDDRLWVVTPLPESGVEHVRRVHRLITISGAMPVEMSMHEHDSAVALVSHTPQVVSSALAAQLIESDEDAVRIAGQGLRDMTRIAASNVRMWSDILAANAGPVAQVLDQVAARLQRTAAALRAVDAGDDAAVDEVTAVLSGGVAGQSRIPGKHGAAPSAYREVLVQIADRPGELGRLFSVAAEADVNLEDVRIEHVMGRPSGLVGLSVRPDAGEELVGVLRERGFEVRG
jgi:prephenate dehydrogenase